MSCQTLPSLPTVRNPVVPRRPVARLGSAARPKGDGDAGNLFDDVFAAPPTPLATPVERARARARRAMTAALDRAEARAMAEFANLWQAEPDRPDARVTAAAPVPDAELIALRAALSAPADHAPDAPATTAERDRLRLAAHVMNTTLTIAYPPVGAVVMTYSFLRGENLRLTARTMVLMGGVMTLMHSHIPFI